MMSKIRSFLCVCVVLFNACDCSDVFHEGSKITFTPNYPADFFGYAITFSESTLIVGAPKANTSGPNPIAAGVVFSCAVQHLETQNVSCKPLVLPRLRSNFFQNDMWFGASLAAGPTGKIMICAPRRTQTFRDNLRMNGLCYFVTKRLKSMTTPLAVESKQVFKSSNITKNYADYISDTKASFTRYFYYQFGQAGMAIKVTGDEIILGAPGLLAWSGGIIRYAIDTNVNSIKFNRKPVYNPFFTHDVGPDEYFGYSVESGIFEDGGHTLYVVGGPKGKKGFGVVLIFEPPNREEEPLEIVVKLDGPQLGAYFGASLCCLDVNGDGRTDLLVGAPNYVKWFDRDALYDQGTVYVYLNKEQATGFILGYAGQVTGSKTNGAKFGYTIADLGDIDGDGFTDVAVGAPRENDGVGAVYIYGGDKHGLKNQYLQRIVASEAKGFGMGLTRGYDVDNNQFNDLIIGAPESATAYVYRCIPTVKVQTAIKIPDILSLPQNTTNFTAQFCVEVLPLKIYTTTEIKLKAMVTVDPKGNRATLVANSTYTVSAVPEHDNCEERVIEIEPAADLSKPIAITFDVEPIDIMQDNPTQFATNARRISDDSNLHCEFDIQLMRDCGEDLICKPRLHMTLEPMIHPYVPGSEGRLGAIIKVLNTEEPAFGIRVNLTLSSQPKRVPATCSMQGLDMVCALPSPLNRNHTVTWEVELEYSQEMNDVGVAMIAADIDDPATNRNVSDNASQYLEINIVPITIISASGKALPNVTVTLSGDKLSEDSRVPFVHYFQVTNVGPSDCLDLNARILLPEMVSLVSRVAGCEENGETGEVTLDCSWSVKAKESLPIELRYNLEVSAVGKYLEEDTSCNISTTLYIDMRNRTTPYSITTVFILDPASPLWILIIGSAVTGLLLLAFITYGMHKCGLLSRTRHPNCKTLQVEPCEQNGCASTPEAPEACNDTDAEDLSKPSCSFSTHSSSETSALNST